MKETGLKKLTKQKIYQIQGVTNEPTGNSEKSEPRMGFEPTTLRDLVRML